MCNQLPKQLPKIKIFWVYPNPVWWETSCNDHQCVTCFFLFCSDSTNAGRFSGSKSSGKESCLLGLALGMCGAPDSKLGGSDSSSGKKCGKKQAQALDPNSLIYCTAQSAVDGWASSTYPYQSHPSVYH